MDGTLKLGLMTAITIIGLWAVAWVIAEVVVLLTKDKE